MVTGMKSSLILMLLLLSLTGIGVFLVLVNYCLKGSIERLGRTGGV